MNGSRKFALSCAVAFALMSLQGCWVTSIYPYAEPSDIVQDDTLLGTWVVPGEGCTLTFNKYHEPLQMYLATYSAPKESRCYYAGVASFELTARLYQVGKNRFLDMGQSRTDELFVAPVHVLLKVAKDGERLKLVPIDFDYVDHAISDGELPLEARVGFGRWGSAMNPDDEVVLISKTPELRKFVLENGDNPKVFNASRDDMVALTFERRTNAAKDSPAKPSK